MSNLFIAEFDELVITDNGIPPFGKFDAATKLQTVTIGGSTQVPSRPRPSWFVLSLMDAHHFLHAAGLKIDLGPLLYGSHTSASIFGVDAEA